MEKFYENKTILVTGGVGSIGSEIVRILLKFNPKAIRILDTNETGLFELEQDLKSDKIRTLIGDVRDKERIKLAMNGIDIVFHAAALKHVELCEYNPFEAVKTNVNGTQNVIDAAIEENVEMMMIISTDKAVNPISVMGASKLLAERLTTAANLAKGKARTVLSAVRFGNVLDSRGSILPIIKNQIRKGGSVTLTDERMTRFIMSIEDAVMLVLKAASIAQGGEIFILKMPSVKIKDLIETAIEGTGMKIETIGKRPGEKIAEELMTNTEASCMKELEDMYIVYPEEMCNNGEKEGYGSENTKHISKEDIKKILKKIKWEAC
ncbi:SDR family NAD(P)-dependent oxidoreductase [Thermoproteota archaeon]